MTLMTRGFTTEKSQHCNGANIVPFQIPVEGQAESTQRLIIETKHDPTVGVETP